MALQSCDALVAPATNRHSRKSSGTPNPIKSIVIPGKLAIASATRNPGVSKALLDAGFHRHDHRVSRTLCNEFYFTARIGTDPRLSIGIDHEFQEIRIGIAHIDACALGAAIVAPTAPFDRPFDYFRPGLIEGGVQRLRRTRPDETKIATPGTAVGPRSVKRPLCQRSGA